MIDHRQLGRELDIFDSDPPFVGGAFENNYDESLADVRGRFWYAAIKKRF